jgi:ethanolamine utilization microcompartment shell protein EutS
MEYPVAEIAWPEQGVVVACTTNGVPTVASAAGLVTITLGDTAANAGTAQTSSAKVKREVDFIENVPNLLSAHYACKIATCI